MPPFCHIWKLIPQLDQPQPAFTNQTQTLVARVIRLLMSKIWHVVNWGHYSCPTRWCNFAWPWVSWQNFQGRGAWYGFSATAEILVNAKFHLAVRRGSVRVLRARPLNETGVVFLPLIWCRCTTC